MTAADTEPADLGDVAEDLLRKAGTIALALNAERMNPAEVAAVAQAMALAGTGLIQLDALDWAREVAETRAPVVEIVLDGTGDLWVRVDAAEDMFECVSTHCEDQSLEQIGARFGIAREFVAAPRPAG